MIPQLDPVHHVCMLASTVCVLYIYTEWCFGCTARLDCGGEVGPNHLQHLPPFDLSCDELQLVFPCQVVYIIAFGRTNIT